MLTKFLKLRLDRIYHSSMLLFLSLFLINQLYLNGRRILSATDHRKLLNFTWLLVSRILIKCAKNIHKPVTTNAEAVCKESPVV